MVDHKRKEQQEQIKDREGEKPLRCRLVRAPVESPGKAHKIEPERGRKNAIGERSHADKGRADSKRREQDCVDQDLAAGFRFAGNNRHHWHAGAAVILIAEQGQRPEVRRRPHEDHGKQDQRLDRQPASDGSPPDDRWQGTRGAADNNVLRRAAFQPHGIDNTIEENGEGKKRRSKPVGGKAEKKNRQGGDHKTETQCLGRLHGTGRHRTVAGAFHHRVDIAVIPLVDGT